MHLINYDLYDIHALLNAIRLKPADNGFAPMLEKIIGYLEKSSADNGLECNAVRKQLKPFVNEDNETLGWVYTENIYTANIRIIKDEYRYKLLIAVLNETAAALKENDTEKTTLLTDAVHNIPCALADDLKPKKRILSEISEYRKRYNKNFLRNELY